MTDRFQFVPPAVAVAAWGAIEPLIVEVIERAQGGQSPDDVLTCIQTGRMQLWREIDSGTIGLTEILEFPRYKVMLIYMVAGSGARDWIAQGQQQLERFARQHGCKFLEFMGRPGWERLARNLGYGAKLIKMRKEL